MQKINLELKHFCSNFTPIRRILKKDGVRNLGIVFQKDYFFNLPSTNSPIKPRLKLRIEKGKQELIFYKRGNFKKNIANPAQIYVYKVKDKELLNFLKETLGVRAIVEKKRERWRKDNIIFNLDKVNNIGSIFEIEIETTPKNRKKDEIVFDQYRKKFQKYLGKTVKGSNVDLLKNQS